MAMDYWTNQKLNCARTTCSAVLKYYGCEEYMDPLSDAFIPFGGGIGEGYVCGVVLGGLASISLVLRKKGLEPKVVLTHCNDFKRKFTETETYLECNELLKPFATENGKLPLEAPGRKEYCTEIIKKAVAIIQQIIDEA